MKWKYFKLLINLLALAGIIASFVIEDRLMAIFFLLALILSEIEDLHDTIKSFKQ